ncbi:MAG: pyridoxamine 5'-phosphate oxidase family protein [Anaerolineae bacterium]|jgi:hypothetical protein
MSIHDRQPGLIKALSDDMTPKFLATRSADGIPNVVPCTSLMPAGDVEDRLIFGNFLLRKSVGNLDADPRVGVLVITTDLEGWILQGEFVGWQRTGAYVDRLNSNDLLRYNAYTGIRNAGIVQVRAVLRRFRLSRLRVLADYLLARAAGRPAVSLDGATKMPPVVQKKFSPITAVRVLAFLEGAGYPLAAPVLSLQPAGESVLVCAEGQATDLLEWLAPGDPVAANLLTLDIVSFQAKGRWLGSRRLLGAPVGAMSVTAVYAGGPPIPGRQVA